MHRKAAVLFLWLIVGMVLLNVNPLAAQVPWKSGLSQGRDLTVKLVTFGVGDDIPSYWGHTALIVEDNHYHISRIYNFGLYSFDDKMLLEFLMGRLIFSAGSSSVPGYLLYYKHQNRDVRLVTLNLPAQKRLDLAKKLEISVLPENRDYLYHHYFNNCSTRLRDLIDQAVDGQFKKATSIPARMTLRQHTIRYIARNPALEMALMYLMNDEIDRPELVWDEMFLPDELERQVLKFSYIDSLGMKHKLAEDRFIFYKAHRPPVPEVPPRHWPYALLIGMLLGLLGTVIAYRFNKHFDYRWRIVYGTYNFLLGLLIGIPGLTLTFLASFTEHTVTYHNENLLMANMITFLLIPVALALIVNKPWSFRWLKYLWYWQAAGGFLAVAIKILPCCDQNNYLVMAFILPISFGLLAASLLIDYRIKAMHREYVE